MASRARSQGLAPSAAARISECVASFEQTVAAASPQPIYGSPSDLLWTPGVFSDPARCFQLTNFPPGAVQQLINDVDAKISERRGRQPVFLTSDTVFSILCILKVGLNFRDFAALFGTPGSAKSLCEQMNRVLPVLRDSLLSWQEKNVLTQRPTLMEIPAPFVRDNPENAIGLVSDCTPWPIRTPSASSQDKKMFFSVHDRCHCLRSEVAVMASRPYQAVFWSKTAPGSTSDLTLWRTEMRDQYTDFLRATPEEENTIFHEAGGTHSWALLQDSGYTSSDATPYPRIVLSKVPPSGADDDRRERYYKNRRVVVEQFFGRLKRLWQLLSKPFIFERASPPLWIDCAIILTNMYLSQQALLDSDGDFYCRWPSYLPATGEEQIAKRRRSSKESYQKYVAKVAAAAAARPVSGTEGDRQAQDEVQANARYDAEERMAEESEEEERPRRRRSVRSEEAAAAREDDDWWGLGAQDVEAAQVLTQALQTTPLLRARCRGSDPTPSTAPQP